MPVEDQGVGFAGIAFEAVAGTFVAATKMFPIQSESLGYTQASQWRRVIRGIADELGAVQGNSSIAGDIVMECLPDVLPYFLYASRNTVAKTGVSPLTYTCTPFHGANPTATRTLSITVVRNGVGFAYTGCVVSAIKIGVNNGVLIMTISVVGRDEANQTPPAQSYANQSPFGNGMYTVAVPTGSTVLDVNTFEFTANDNASPEWRLSTVRVPQVVRFGQRDVGLTMNRDFLTRTEYDAFKVLTAQSVRVVAANGANANVQITCAAALKDTYVVNGLGNQGDLVNADMMWHGTYDTATSKSYEIIVVTTESIT